MMGNEWKVLVSGIIKSEKNRIQRKTRYAVQKHRSITKTLT